MVCAFYLYSVNLRILLMSSTITIHRLKKQEQYNVESITKKDFEALMPCILEDVGLANKAEQERAKLKSE